MTVLTKTMEDLEKSFGRDGPTMLQLIPVGISGILIAVVRFLDGRIEVWKVTP